MKRSVFAALVGTALMFAATSASANLIPSLVSVTAVGDGTFTWLYSVSISPDQFAQPGPGTAPPAVTLSPQQNGAQFADYFTISDFQGLVPASASSSSPLNWAFSSLLVGSTPSSIVVPDDPTIPNLTWYKIGGTLFGPQDNFATFSVRSVFGDVDQFGFYAADGSKNTLEPGLSGSAVANIGLVPAPAVPRVPEPGTLLLLGVTLVGVVVSGRRLHR